jgi:hypothetical protein
MVLKVIASREIEAFAVFRALLKMEMSGYLVEFVSSQIGAVWQLSHRRTSGSSYPGDWGDMI